MSILASWGIMSAEEREKAISDLKGELHNIRNAPNKPVRQALEKCQSLGYNSGGSMSIPLHAWLDLVETIERM